MGILDKIFKKKVEEQSVQRMAHAQYMSGNPPIFSPFSGNAYESDIYRSAVDAIARNVGKLKATHTAGIAGERTIIDDNLTYLLQVRPNPYMSSYDLIYKLVTHYYLYNNAFAYLQRDSFGNVVGIFPIMAQQVDYLTDEAGEMYCKFLFAQGQSMTANFEDVIVLRRFFNANDLLGDSNRAIFSALSLANTQSEGIENAIKSSATLKGILKYNSIMSTEKLRQEQEIFTRDYLNISNSGGIAVLDSKSEYIPLNSYTQTSAIDAVQVKAVQDKIYNYLGINESIVNSSYTGDEWASFYESIIEPLALQLSLEFTHKIFNKMPSFINDSIEFTANRLQFTNNTTKLNMIKELLPMGLFTLNDAREILNLPLIHGEEGNKRLQSLNYVDMNVVNEYQMSRGGENHAPTHGHDGDNH